MAVFSRLLAADGAAVAVVTAVVVVAGVAVAVVRTTPVIDPAELLKAHPVSSRVCLSDFPPGRCPVNRDALLLRLCPGI